MERSLASAIDDFRLCVKKNNVCVRAPRSRAWQTCFFLRRKVTYYFYCVDLRSSSTHTQSPFTKSEKVITQRMPDRPSNGPFFPKQFPSLLPRTGHATHPDPRVTNVRHAGHSARFETPGVI